MNSNCRITYLNRENLITFPFINFIYFSHNTCVSATLRNELVSCVRQTVIINFEEKSYV